MPPKIRVRNPLRGRIHEFVAACGEGRLQFPPDRGDDLLLRALDRPEIIFIVVVAYLSNITGRSGPFARSRCVAEHLRAAGGGGRRFPIVAVLTQLLHPSRGHNHGPMQAIT